MSPLSSSPCPLPAGEPDSSPCLPCGGATVGEAYDATCSVGHQIVNVMMLMRRVVELRMAAHGLTNAQWRPLWMIDRGRAATTNELARVMDVDASAVTRLVDRLAAKGLIERVRSSTDRRVVKLNLTPAGQDIVKVIEPVLAEVNRDFLSGFHPDERAALQAALTRMTTNGAALLNRCGPGAAEAEGAASAPAHHEEPAA